ncbi:MAG: OB-fold domain-containing protein [Desulfobacterales bacterium]
MENRPFSDISFRAFLSENRLMGSQCGHCDALYVPPRPICPSCHASKMDWVEMSGKGKLAAFTCIAIGPAAMIAEGYNRDNPYCSAVMELDEGARVDGRLEGIDPRKPEEIIVGMPLKVHYRHRKDKETYLAFEPVIPK